jgi:hypothetical protein
VRIKPEHIAEMKYVDCRDTEATDMPKGQNALFVVLKPGIGFDPAQGSFVARADDADPVAAPVSAPSDAYRRRILGVFDDSTGAVLSGVEVVDFATGTFATTTPTGTASLAFLPEGTATIELRKTGYASQKLEVTISPRDTLPITVLLSPKKP